jgi:uncharacterized protein YukE
VVTSVADPTAGADPGSIRALADRLKQVASTAGQLQSELGTMGTSWTGNAAASFQTKLHELPGELAHVSSSFVAASSALYTWAGDVEEFQQEARRSLSAYSAASDHLLALQRAAPPARGKPVSPAIVAAEHEAQADARNAQASLNGIAHDFAVRAALCKTRIDAAAPHVKHGVFGDLLVVRSMGKKIGAVKGGLKLAGKGIKAARHDAAAARSLGRELWGDSLKSKLKLKSGLEKGLDGISKNGERYLAKGGVWGKKLGKSAEHLANTSLKGIDEASHFKSFLRAGGRVLPGVGAFLSGLDMRTNLGRRHWLDAGVDAVQVVAFGVIAVGVAVGSPVVGLAAVGLGVAIAATTVYQNRGAIVSAALATGDALVTDVDAARGDSKGAARSGATTEKRLHEAWTAFTR